MTPKLMVHNGVTTNDGSCHKSILIVSGGVTLGGMAVITGGVFLNCQQA